MKKLIIVVFSAILLGSCSTGQLYYWDNYTMTSYNVKKEPTEKNKSEHTSVLKRIIEKSQKNRMRVPPGIYAEYGFVLMNDNKVDEGVKFLKLEKETYPESATLMDLVINKIGKQ